MHAGWHEPCIWTTKVHSHQVFNFNSSRVLSSFSSVCTFSPSNNQPDVCCLHLCQILIIYIIRIALTTSWLTLLGYIVISQASDIFCLCISLFFFKALYGKQDSWSLRSVILASALKTAFIFSPSLLKSLVLFSEGRSGNHSISQYQKQKKRNIWRLPLVILVHFLSTTVNQNYLSMPISWPLPFWDYDCRIHFKPT